MTEPELLLCDGCGRLMARAHRQHAGKRYCGTCYAREFKRRLCPQVRKLRTTVPQRRESGLWALSITRALCSLRSGGTPRRGDHGLWTGLQCVRPAFSCVGTVRRLWRTVLPPLALSTPRA